MSYDVCIKADLGGPEPLCSESTNYTSNCSAMWAAAGLTFRDIDGMLARDAAVLLRATIDELRSDPDRYQPMEPDNGWGSYERGIDWLKKIAALCEAYPNGRVSVS